MSLVHFTSHCASTAELQEACGVPLGMVVQPLGAAGDGAPNPSCWASDLARCARCQAYINALCEVDDLGWACALCGCSNDFSSAAGLRRYYGLSAERRAALPELASPVVDALCALVSADPEEGVEEVLALEAQPVVLAIVDAGCEEEGLELVKGSLAAAVEALPPAARFGLVSFGSQVCLHPVANGGASGAPDKGVVHIPLAGEDASAISLQDAVPLGAMLASVGSHKASILAAIEGMEAEPPVGGGRQRALGDALRAVLRWVAVGAHAAAAEGLHAQHAQQGEGAGSDAPHHGAAGFPGLRLLLFLSGPPNCGTGAVVARVPSPAEQAAAQRAQQAAAEQAAQELASLVLDPQYPELSAWNDAVRSAPAQQQHPAAQAAAEARAAAGDLSHAAPPGVPAEQLEVNLAAREFYAEAGAAAAALGASVDIFAACPQWMGLELLEPLAASSGGSITLYRSLEAAAMTQDVYKSVSQPRALACLLRLRCSPELELKGAHGRLAAADREELDLFSLVSCAPDDAFAFDLDRSTQRLACSAPAVQLVLQYSVLLPAGGQDGGPADGSRFVLHRRMRVITAAVPLAPTPQHLFSSCDPEALACVVAHKALATAVDQGVLEARQMLFDWLALLTAAVAEQGGANRKADASLTDIQALHHLPHLVFALLQGPLLQPGTADAAARHQPAPWRHPDAAAALRSLLQSLPPDELSVAVCPQLSSWSSPESMAVPQHSLSSAALSVGGQPLWVLDSFFQIVVLCTAAGAAGAAPFPPPASSLLRRTLASICAARRCTPELVMLQQGQQDTTPFDEWLLEDAAPAGTAGAAQLQQWPSFVAFLDALSLEAQRLLREGR